MVHLSEDTHVSLGLSGGKPLCHWSVVENAFSPGECSQLSAAFTALTAHEGGLVAGKFDTQVRQSALVWVPESREFDWVAQRMARLAGDANRDTFRFALDGFEEQLQLACYGPGHFYDWHIDCGQGAVARRRKLTLSVQLSAPGDYAGGELEINADGCPFQAPNKLGTMVAFASNTLHRVAPVTEGSRLSLVAWIHGPDFV